MRSGDKNTSPPTYMQTKIYHNMVDDKLYHSKLYELTKLVYDKPLVLKPELGKIPDFDAPVMPDLDKKLIEFNAKEKINGEKYAIIHSVEGVKLFEKESQTIFKNITDNVNHYKDNHNFHLITKMSPFNKSFLISTGNFTYYFEPHHFASNSVADAYITMNFFEGPVGLEYEMPDLTRAQRPIYQRKYFFQIDDQMNLIWVNENDKTDILETNDVHSLMFREVINYELEFRSKKGK